MAIKDIHPQAPVHVLIFAKKHITDMASLSDKDSAIAGKLLLAANKVAKKLGIEKNGFRLIINQGKHSGVLVPHLHIHLLGGRHLGAKIINEKE